MVTKQREDYIWNNWVDEFIDPATLEWRKEITQKEELDLIKHWDSSFNSQSHRFEKGEPIKAVRIDGLMIRHIKNPSSDICKAALEQNPDAIQYIKNPTSEIFEAFAEKICENAEEKIKCFPNTGKVLFLKNNELVEMYKCLQDTSCGYNISEKNAKTITAIGCKIQKAFPDICNIINAENAQTIKSNYVAQENDFEMDI